MLDLLEQRARTAFTSLVAGGAVRECELVARVAQSGNMRGHLFDTGSGNFVGANGAGTPSYGALRALAASPGQEVTYTCVPAGFPARAQCRSSIPVLIGDIRR